MEKKQSKISLKSFCIISAILAVIILTVIVIAIKSKNPREIIGEEEQIALDFVNYEGTFKAKGIVVRVDKEFLIIMPTESNNEYTVQEKFYFTNENNKNLKQGQEVAVTFSYDKNRETIKALLEDIQILKEQAEEEIPYDILVKAYSTKEKVVVSIDKENSNNKKIKFKIEDKNDYKYDYSNMQYKIYRYNPPPEKTEIKTENGVSSIAGYNPWSELTKTSNESTKRENSINEENEIEIELNWSSVYGELKTGKYKLNFATVVKQKTNRFNKNVIDVYEDFIIIDINFEIDENGQILYNSVDIR